MRVIQSSTRVGVALNSSYLVFFAVLRRVLASLGVVTSFQSSIASVLGPLRTIKKIFDERKIYTEKIEGIYLDKFEKEIEIRNLSFQYSDRAVLDAVSFKIEKGQMVAIVGKTGSGKSTVAQLLMRFYDPPRDAVFIDDKDVLDLQIGSWRKKIAYISQDNYFFDASIEINLKYGCEFEPSKQEMLLALEKAQLKEFLGKLPKGLATEIGERGIQLSGGEKQRLSLARAILRKPEILILDEATSAMDSHTEQLIQDAILEVVKGKTSIVIAHRLSTIKNADKIILLENGRLLEQGSFDQLMILGRKFKSYWMTQHD